ncbi:lambda family phage portal protein [Pseudacidovorax sp. 1753]|uniref:phage portal protein n=1 Tax=Pseudacidovorax sp. 1753 TaxID=3156419 RepID=UPI0033995F7D
MGTVSTRAKAIGRATWLDRAIGWANPKQGLKRAWFRDALVRAYEGASKADGWRPRRPGASARADYVADARELRHRARALCANVPYVAQALSVMVSCTIGVGVLARWVGDREGLTGKRWKAWTAFADYDGLLDFGGLMAKAWHTMKVDGEVLVRLRDRRTSPTTAPLQLQLLEIDWLDVDRCEVRGDNEVIAGIEYNGRGERVAYWLFDRHPGDVGFRAMLRESQCVPADEIIHLFNPARPGQQAGITVLAPVIANVRDLQVYEDAEQARKNLEARMGAIGEWDESLLDGVKLPDPGISADGGARPATLDLGELAGGGIVALPPGMRNPQFIQPTAAPGHVEYVKHRQKIIAAGLGVPYEYMTGDMVEVNFSSSRVRTNLYRREVEREQWTLLVPMFLAPIARRWAQLDELVAGPLPGGVFADWTMPKWPSVNPAQDVAADLSEIKGGLQSISEKIRERGYDPDQVFTELRDDLRRLKDDGTLPLLAALLGAANPLELLAALGGDKTTTEKPAQKL